MTAQRGYILLAVSATLLVIGAVSLMLGRSSAVTGVLGDNLAQQRAAELVAEAGLAHIRREVKRAGCVNYGNLAGVEFPPGSGNTYTATVSPSSGSPVSYKVKGATASGLETELFVASERVFSSDGELILQPKAEFGKDVDIRDGVDENDNFGTSNTLYVSNLTQQKRALLEFDISGVPPNVRLTEATVTLNILGVDAGNDIKIAVHKVSKSWVEGTRNGTGNADGATWRDYDGANSWLTDGGDFQISPHAVVPLAAPPDTPATLSIDLKTMVNEWLADPSKNRGFILIGTPSLLDLRLASSDHGSKPLHPKLTLRWRCECGAGC